MTQSIEYAPGPAAGAHVEKDGDHWTLIVVRELRHTPEHVWQALTEPEQLHQWAPFNVDGSLGVAGATVKLVPANNPAVHISETTISHADPPRLLEYNWGAQSLRWELELTTSGTRLTLWHNIHPRFVCLGAASWQIAFDVLDRLLAGVPIGRIAGAPGTKKEWQRLVGEYAQQFGVESAGFPNSQTR